MENIQIILISIFAVFVVGTLAIVIKLMAAPKKIETVRKLLKQGKNQQAAKLTKQIIAKDPKDFVAHYYLGKAYIADGRDELALIEYKTINENALFGPKLPEIPFRKEYAALLMKFNQTQEALKEYLLLTKMGGNDADIFFNLGKLYEQAGRKDLAITFLKKCLKIQPRNAKAHGAIGNILYLTKQYNEAKQELDYAIKLSPETYSNYYYLGKLLKDCRDPAGAVKAFDKAQRDAEFKQKALIERATCFITVNRYDNAIIDLQRAIEIDKEDTKTETLYARYFLAACYEKNRKIDKAIEQWEIINKRNRNFKNVPAKLAEYKDVETDDNLKDYLTCSNSEFTELCKKIAFNSFGLNSHQCDMVKSSCHIIASEAKEGDWRTVRKQMTMLAFFRDSEPVEDVDVRSILDKAKQLGCQNTYVLTSSEFSRTALSYAENRPIELFDRKKLEPVLSKAGK